MPNLSLFGRAWDPLKVLEQGDLNMEKNSGWELSKRWTEKHCEKKTKKVAICAVWRADCQRLKWAEGM